MQPNIFFLLLSALLGTKTLPNSLYFSGDILILLNIMPLNYLVTSYLIGLETSQYFNGPIVQKPGSPMDC